MIINIRGTHGSGKSTLVRNIMGRYEECTAQHIDGRKRPFGYLCRKPDVIPLWIPGSYENATGGCDTIPDVSIMFSAIKAMHMNRYHVLFEGILAQHSFPRIVEVTKLALTVVIVLDTSVVECVDSVQARRNERGDTRPLNPSNIEKEWKSVNSSSKRLRAAGVDLRVLNREAALATVCELLGLTV